MKFKAIFLTALFFIFTLEGFESQYPVDITFLVADLKYNQKDGVKICEIQHGIASAFSGDRYSHGEPGIIPENFYLTLLQYQNEFWTTHNNFSEAQIKNQLMASPEWHVLDHLPAVERNAFFLQQAALPVEDPTNIQSYHGCICTRKWVLNKHRKFMKKYPGIILIDEASIPYWEDKYKMSMLFSRNENLSSFKPRWHLYKKEYDAQLAQKIIEEIKSDWFVIKPRSSYLGNGVIIVNQEDLDETLRYILIKSRQLDKDPDNSYNYWYKDRSHTFLVEEFIASDPLCIPHLDNQLYQPTMRVAFICAYHNREIDLHILGAYWKLPRLSLSDEGTLNEKHKNCGKIPYFYRVDPETLREVEKQLHVALPLLYKEMLIAEN
ncbi:MAG: hypothetical protein K940chlam3_00018 [Chlamydiae bacterium]|nr:hypothetical protein [Chlamydiota bacterium]